MFKLVVLFCAVVGLVAGKPSVGLVAPVAYSSVVPGVSSVSQYSSSVVHGSPLASVYATPYAASYAVPYAAPYALSQAPHTPAVVLDAINGVPLDTPEVVAARAAHYQAKALSGYHHLKKRSVAPLAYSSVVSPVAYSSPLVSAYSSHVVSPYSVYGAPVVSAYSSPVASPLAYHGVVPRAYSVHPW